MVGFDPTALLNITGAQLAQLVNSAAPETDRGFILVSSDSLGVPNVPNANTNTAWQRYIWLRLTSTAVIPYVWNPASATDPTLLNWVLMLQSSFAPNTIPGTALITGSVPASAINSLAYSQLTGAPQAANTGGGNTLTQDGYLTSNLFSNSSFVFGCLQGSGTTPGTTPGTPVLAAGAVTSASIPKQAITGNATTNTGQIVDYSIYSAQLASDGGTVTTNPYTASLGAVDPQCNITVPNKSILGIPSSTNYSLATSGNAVAPGDILAVNCNSAGLVGSTVGYVPVRRAILTLAEPTQQTYPQIPVVAANGTTYALQQYLPLILQEVLYSDSSYVATSGNITTGTAALAYNATGMTSYAAMSNKFTAQSATSTIVVEACIQVGCGSSNQYVYGTLCHDTTSGAASPVIIASGGFCAQSGYLNIKATFASSSSWASGLYLKIYFGIASGTGTTNTLNSSTTSTMGGLVSTIKVTEIA